VSEMDGEERVVRAHRFELIDSNRRTRAVLGTSPAVSGDPYSGAVGLEIFDGDGKSRAWLVDTPGAGVQFCLAANGNQLVVVTAAEPMLETEGGASITICDLEGVPVVEWEVDAEGEPALWVNRVRTPLPGHPWPPLSN
jgi:hypothetical protein